jgi:hypothetical protein
VLLMIIVITVVAAVLTIIAMLGSRLSIGPPRPPAILIFSPKLPGYELSRRWLRGGSRGGSRGRRKAEYPNEKKREDRRYVTSVHPAIITIVVSYYQRPIAVRLTTHVIPSRCRG